MTFIPVGWTATYSDNQCGDQRFYSGGVLCQCELPQGHEGEHRGRDRWGLLGFWSDEPATGDAGTSHTP